MNEQEYSQYIRQVTPTHCSPRNVLRAFLVGGAICALGQGLTQAFLALGVSREEASAWTSVCLILASVLLTGLNLFPSLVKFGGAGALVPITGFANSVAAPAIEYQKEGLVFGTGCKIFTIAGPVILYGTVSSWLLGAAYLLLQAAGAIR